MAKRGRPPKDGEAMTGAERTREWRQRKREAEEAKLSKPERWQAQEERWLAQHREKRRKEIERTVQRHPKVVKEYLTIAIEYRAALKLAVVAAERGMFAPESRHFIEEQHKTIVKLIEELGDALQ